MAESKQWIHLAQASAVNMHGFHLPCPLLHPPGHAWKLVCSRLLMVELLVESVYISQTRQSQ